MHSPPGGFTYIDLHLICSTQKVCYFCDKENENQSSIITQFIIRKMWIKAKLALILNSWFHNTYYNCNAHCPSVENGKKETPLTLTFILSLLSIFKSRSLSLTLNMTYRWAGLIFYTLYFFGICWPFESWSPWCAVPPYLLS